MSTEDEAERISEMAREAVRISGMVEKPTVLALQAVTEAILMIARRPQ